MSSCVGCTAEVQLEDTFCARCGAPVTDPFIGVTVGGRYRIASRIGIGGMGAVYRAEHTMMRRDLAIKVLLPELSGKEEFARRFEREAESASRLAHPNIIAVTDFGHTNEGSLFLVMEFLAGESLSAAIAGGPMPLPRALNILRQMLRGLEHAHAAGVIHRDLKPENIMLVERDGQRDVVKILDFGIAKVTQPQSGGEALTQAGVIFGTPEYLSPEQALGEAVDARADIYAAGVIFYEMLAGRRPFESEDKVKIISMHLSHAPPRVRDVNPTVDCPAPLEQVIMQTLDKSRENRFATATAFLRALDDAESPEDDFAADAGELVPPQPRHARGAFGAVRRLAGRRSGLLGRGRAGRRRARRWVRRRQAQRAATRPRWSHPRPRRRRRRPTWPTASRRSKPGWRTATCRRRAAAWSRRCRSAPRTAACATCWAGSPTPTTSTRRRCPTTARRSRSTAGSGETPCCWRTWTRSSAIPRKARKAKTSTAPWTC